MGNKKNTNSVEFSLENVSRMSDLQVLELLKKANPSEMVALQGSVYNYYIQHLLVCEKNGLKKSSEYLCKKIEPIEISMIQSIKKSKQTVMVLTPVYNRAHLIQKVLDSVTNQTYEDYLYVVLDDGSIDNTGKIVSRHFQGRDNHYYLYHKNQGEAETVNRAWGLCNVEYFVQVNSDDPVKENLLTEMTKSLDRRKDCVLAYCDFDIVDDHGKLIEQVKSPDYNFLKDLSEFSCYAASPGALFRRSALKDIKALKDGRFKHTNDIKMLWNLALRGEFLHVPLCLATWMSHVGGISSNRYEAIDEINVWIEEYFNQPLPSKVKDIEPACRRSIYNYFASLMDASHVEEKDHIASYYRQKAIIPMPRYRNLLVGDNDLVGNKFNGHDLHINLRKRNVDSSHLVWNKESDDPNTYLIAGGRPDRIDLWNYIRKIQGDYDLDNIQNPLIYEILYNKLFLDADVVHLHLLHNGLWDLNLLPIMSSLKPIVLTIHDMWIVSGHPRAVERPDYFLPLRDIKNYDLNYELKKRAFEDSNISLIVASRYMEDAVREYEIFKNSKITYIPFGLDFSVFRPKNKASLRKKYGILAGKKVVLARGDNRHKKGLDYIEYLFNQTEYFQDVHLIVVGGNELEIDKNISTTYLGWINDDMIMSELYNIADLFLMPSTVEPFGMMAIESMACGTVPIVLEGTALPDTVGAPNCGVATKQDKVAYSTAVEYYLAHDDERTARGKKCVEYVREKHDMETYLDAIEGVYSDAIANMSPSAESKKVIESIKLHNEITPYIYPRPPIVPIPQYSYFTKLRLMLKYQGVLFALRVIIRKLLLPLRYILRYNYKNTIQKCIHAYRQGGLPNIGKSLSRKMKSKISKKVQA